MTETWTLGRQTNTNKSNQTLDARSLLEGLNVLIDQLERCAGEVREFQTRPIDEASVSALPPSKGKTPRDLPRGVVALVEGRGLGALDVTCQICP